MPTDSVALSLACVSMCQTFPNYLLHQSPSVVCKLDILGSSPNVSMRCARTVHVLGTRVTWPVSWCISKSARTSSQLFCAHGGLASNTYSDTPRVFWVYHWTLIAYPFRVTSTPSIILVLRELFFSFAVISPFCFRNCPAEPNNLVCFSTTLEYNP